MIGVRVVRHGRAITIQLAEVAVTGPMVRAIRAVIRRLEHPHHAHDGIPTETKLNRLDRSVRRAEKWRRGARVM